MGFIIQGQTGSKPVALPLSYGPKNKITFDQVIFKIIQKIRTGVIHTSICLFDPYAVAKQDSEFGIINIRAHLLSNCLLFSPLYCDDRSSSSCEDLRLFNFIWWRLQDSNLGTRMGGDLQSPDFAALLRRHLKGQTNKRVTTTPYDTSVPQRESNP